jgi:hypothetical protein
MPKHKERLHMSKSASARCPAEAVEQQALAKYRAKSAAMVHKAVGDPEQVCKDGLQVFDALSPARERANKSAIPNE